MKNKLQHSYMKTKEFCETKGLKMNAAKTQFIILMAPAKKVDCDTFLTIDGITLQPLKSVKQLGFTIDKHLTFKSHIDDVIRQCKSYLSILRKSSKLLSRKLLLLTYNALIRSRLEYCSSVFAAASKTNVNKLESV